MSGCVCVCVLQGVCASVSVCVGGCVRQCQCVWVCGLSLFQFLFFLGVPSVVLSLGPYEYSQKTVINSSIKDYLKIPTSNLTNNALPSSVIPGSRYDLRLNLMGDHFFLPSTLEVSLTAKLLVKEDNGSFRKITAADGLCPIDGLQFIKNVRPQFDNQPLLPSSKECNQRLFRRIIQVLTKSDTKESKQSGILRKQEYYETQSLEDNIAAKTHSHKYDGDKIEFKAESDSNMSVQNTQLSRQLCEEFICPINFNGIAPFDVGKILTRPIQNLLLSLEVCAWNEWLTLTTPDGTPGKVKPSMDIFNKLCLQITGIKNSLSQVVLHDKLFDLYFKNTAKGKIASMAHSIIDYHSLSNPVPTKSSFWELNLYNQIIADRFFLVFHTEKNLLNGAGNYYYFSNPGLKSLCLKVSGCSLNRYNQHRTSAWTDADKVIVSSMTKFNALNLNEQHIADMANMDLIVDPNTLAVGGLVGDAQRETYVCNLRSIYGGHCVYSFSTSVQTETNSNLRENSRKGNVSLQFTFSKPTAELYYVTVYAVHNGVFYR